MKKQGEIKPGAFLQLSNCDLITVKSLLLFSGPKLVAVGVRADIIDFDYGESPQAGFAVWSGLDVLVCGSRCQIVARCVAGKRLELRCELEGR